MDRRLGVIYLGLIISERRRFSGGLGTTSYLPLLFAYSVGCQPGGPVYRSIDKPNRSDVLFPHHDSCYRDPKYWARWLGESGAGWCW